MIWYVPLNDDNLGGSIWIRHIAETLSQLGHEIRYCHYESDTSAGDYTLIQSEWIEKVAYKTAKSAVVLLGHFTSEVYPDPTKLSKRDIILTQWKGEVVEDFEKRSGLKTTYFPHGYFQNWNTYEMSGASGFPFIGSHTPFRDLSRFNNTKVDVMSDVNPEFIDCIYYSACICPNVHLNIQKGELINVPESILTKPGYAVNERLFWIPGAEGFQLADENPLIREFYAEDEVPMAMAAEFKEKFEYYLNHLEERRTMAEKAHERTMKEHTYKHRIESILLPLL